MRYSLKAAESGCVNTSSYVHTATFSIAVCFGEEMLKTHPVYKLQVFILQKCSMLCITVTQSRGREAAHRLPRWQKAALTCSKPSCCF